jgi:hypothetical protein
MLLVLGRAFAPAPERQIQNWAPKKIATYRTHFEGSLISKACFSEIAIRVPKQNGDLEMNIADQPIVNDQLQQPLFIDDVVEELLGAIADLTKVVDFLAATKTHQRRQRLPGCTDFWRNYHD